MAEVTRYLENYHFEKAHFLYENTHAHAWCWSSFIAAYGGRLGSASTICFCLGPTVRLSFCSRDTMIDTNGLSKAAQAAARAGLFRVTGPSCIILGY